MPKSTASHRSMTSSQTNEDEDYTIQEHEAEAIRNAYRNAFNVHSQPLSPAETRTSQGGYDLARRRLGSSRTSDGDLRLRIPSRGVSQADERTGLLTGQDPTRSGYRTTSTPGTPRYGFARSHSYTHTLRDGSRRGSFAKGLMNTLRSSSSRGEEPPRAKRNLYWDDRVWYDQFTCTDWVHDSIADAYRVKELRSRQDFWGRVKSLFDGAQGWLLVLIIGCLTAAVAYVIDVTETAVFDYKSGYCTKHWWYSKSQCCNGASICSSWHRWSNLIHHDDERNRWTDYAAYVTWCVVLSVISCLITLKTKTSISSAISLSTLDENLGADHHHQQQSKAEGGPGSMSPTSRFEEASKRPPMTYYPAAGSGVAEVRVILSGFVLHGYLGVRTLVCKTLGLILSVASGLSVGKEGPYVHIAACIGNICTRLSSKYRNNDAKRREVLSASAAAGVAVAFGAPIGGVLFSLEEVSYYFPPKTLFRTFFCCIAAALSLRAFNPYGTNKIVLFEVRYMVDWKFFEMIAFACLGILGGALGALFIKASKLWAKTFRRIGVIKKYPIFEVFLVAVATGLVSFWNRYTRLPVAELLYDVAAPCSSFTDDKNTLCPTEEAIPRTIWYLSWALVVKAVLTTVTFGIKVPAGIYVPSMVVGGLLGRIVGHIVQLLTLKYPDIAWFASCPNDGNPESCVVPGVYALVAAGATMCGVTRLSVTLAVILFELTGSLEHVLPFSLGVLIAKWTADAIEPLSIYDLLTDMNAYPYLDHKVRPVFTTDLGDITPEPSANKYIDISASPLVPAKQLRFKLEYLHISGEIDGGLPILKDGVLVGLIPGPDLEYALDRLENEEEAMCLMNAHDQILHPGNPRPTANTFEDDDEDDGATARQDDNEAGTAPRRGSDGPGNEDPTDFTPYIDPSPVALDITSPMDLVYECFVKLGLRYICVLYEGKYSGMVHKKSFVRYVKYVHDEERRNGKVLQRGF